MSVQVLQFKSKQALQVLPLLSDMNPSRQKVVHNPSLIELEDKMHSVHILKPEPEQRLQVAALSSHFMQLVPSLE